MLYKQHRFNLQREETEGFAKLLVLLSDVRDGNHLQAEENMRRLIGYFDLDPNRLMLCPLPFELKVRVRLMVLPAVLVEKARCPLRLAINTWLGRRFSRFYLM